MLIEIIIVVVFVIALILISYFSVKNRKKEHTIMPIGKDLFTNQEISSNVNPFDQILSAIETRFSPSKAETEKDYEIQLIAFLGREFPNRVIRPGHTRQGVGIDIAIDGTYAIELITLDNEGRLVTVTDQMFKSQFDFEKTAVILVDTGKLDEEKIKEYLKNFKNLKINAIVKKVE